MARVFFEKVDPGVTREQLREFFSRAGVVKGVMLVTDRGGKSMGFGFVEMLHADDAKYAVKALGKSLVQGSSIRLNAPSSR
jgi:RNA recognition motif-containing protein